MRRLDDAKKKRLFELRAQGTSVRQIASEFKISQQAVSYHLYPRYKESTIKRAISEKKPSKESGWQLIYFKCPKCGSADIDVHLLKNRYECNKCRNIWK